MKKFMFILLFSLVSLFMYGQKIHTPECRYYNPNTVPKAGAELCKICHKSTADDPNNPTYTCGALTKKGTPCKRKVKVAGTHCPQHTTSK
jgi:hypothetical protein